MPTEFQSFAGAVQGRITAPVGWTIVGGFLKRWVAYGSGEINGDLSGQMTFDTYSAGLRTISAPMRWNSVGGGSEWGFCALNEVRSGFSLIVKNASTTLRKDVAGAAGSTIATLVTTNTANATYSMDFDDSTGAITVKKNGTTVLTGTYTDTPNLKLGIRSYNSGTAQSYASVTIDYTPAQEITSINSGNPITANQTTVASVTTGFTGLPTSITCNLAGITCSSIGGTTNAPTFVKSQRVNGQPWPLNGATATFTYVNGSESANGTQVIQKEDAEVVYTFSGVITDDPASIGYWLAQDGFTVEGGEHSYTPYGDLVLTADGGGTVTDAGTFHGWFRPATGIGAGNVYSYTWNTSEAGTITVVSRFIGSTIKGSLLAGSLLKGKLL